jgi:hypothetical protein
MLIFLGQSFMKIFPYKPFLYFNGTLFENVFLKWIFTVKSCPVTIFGSPFHQWFIMVQNQFLTVLNQLCY